LVIRPFRNTDPPRLVRLWHRQPPRRALAARVDVNILEAIVFSKPYFDRNGLLIAEENGDIQGFAHGGFGADSTGSNICTELGVTCLLIVDPDVDRQIVGSQLLRDSEAYLRARGAKVLYGGGIRPLDPFYLGLYGGSELPGILASDQDQLRLFQQASYRTVDQCLVLHAELSTFRPPMDRRQLMLKRSHQVAVTHPPPPATWWEACTAPCQEPTRFEIFRSADGTSVGRVSYWWMDPVARGWGSVTAGLYDLFIDDDQRRQGVATMLISESLRQLRLNGVQRVEAQTMVGNHPAIELYRKLGFEEVDRGFVLRKDETTAHAT
jgi:ribosomal protein S18 acetylase RimI-like enzyme